MSSWKKYFKPVQRNKSVISGDERGSFGMNNFNSYLSELYKGPPNRLKRYEQYDQMDADHEVSAALDTISEFSTTLNADNLPFSLKFKEEPSGSEVKILKKALQQWCHINEFNRRIFGIFRSVLKYGDHVFIRDPETFKLFWVDIRNVEKILVNESNGKIPSVYFIKNLDLNLRHLTASTPGFEYRSMADLEMPANNAYLNRMSNVGSLSGSGSSTSNVKVGSSSVYPVDANHVVHISLSDGMNSAWPLGLSILEKVLKVYKQKELLEDAVIIYRVHRAPERRVFLIDTGDMPPHKAQQYIEKVKLEIQQKRIPSRTGGGDNIMDSSYNPMSMLEDYFFAVSGDSGRGSKVEILPGGENLGKIDDLKFWNNKMFRALGIPSSYLPTGPEDGSASFSDGRVGRAFIQEFRFNKTCKRYQRQIKDVLDKEFKLFLKFKGVSIESSLFSLEFNEPQSFQDYRMIELNAAHVNTFMNVINEETISKRFAFKKYLGWTEQEILENERLWKEEHGLLDEVDINLSKDARAIGINKSQLNKNVMSDTDVDMEIDDSYTDEETESEESNDNGEIDEV